MRETRDRPRGRDQDHRFRRRFWESLNIMHNRSFQSGEGGQLRGQAAKRLCAGHGQATETGKKRLRTDKSARRRENTVQKKEARGTTQESRPAQERGPRPRAGTTILGPGSPEGPQAANKPGFAERCDAGMKFLIDNHG